MLRIIFISFISCCSQALSAQITYRLTYRDSSSARVKITIQLPATQLSAINFIMPRSVPGTYGITMYDQFISNLYAISNHGEKHAMTKDGNDAPRWSYVDSNRTIRSIEYEVDLDKMERKLAPSDASVIRPGFAGILNYSVLGWVEGTQYEPVQCSIETFSNWPIFSTIHPTLTMEKSLLTFNTDNYYTLTDGQLFMGPRFRVKAFAGIVPLFIASYSQTSDEYLDDYGWQGTSSLGILKDYFGEIPFSKYSILLRNVIPLEPGSHPSFGMEHLQSSTFFGDTSGIRNGPMSKADVIKKMPTFLHHMAHAFIPLRCYGDAYQPVVMEIPPIINNIWFNEGFMWFLPYDTLHLERMKVNFVNSVYNTSPGIKKMSLQQLSQTASVMYATDFRLGKSVYSRGALMAIEMNHYLLEKSAGKSSMKDVLRYLYQWTKNNKRAFTMEELPQLINEACKIDLGEIYKKWQLPIVD